MIKLLPDNNAGGHVEILVRVLMSETWLAFWNDLEAAVVTFEHLKVERDSDDDELWRACQRQQVVLITNNRNAIGPKSLERVIRAENTAHSLPVFTLADPDRLSMDRDYAESTAVSLLENLYRLDKLLGTGRLYLP